MSIPKWREIEYTDDGCSLYQCLHCYEKWEGRSSPEYGWKFCPFCGVKWDGQEFARKGTESRWHWDLIGRELRALDYDDKSEESQRLWKGLYERDQVIDSHLKENRKSREAREMVWSIEWSDPRQPDRWIHEAGLSTFRYPARKAIAWKNDSEQLAEAERQEQLVRWDYDDDLPPLVAPARAWRIRLVTFAEYRETNPYKYPR